MRTPKTPPEIVAAAIAESPEGRATLAEISARTGYPVEQVLKQIGHVRRNIGRVNAVMGERDETGFEPTRFELAGLDKPGTVTQ